MHATLAWASVTSLIIIITDILPVSLWPVSHRISAFLCAAMRFLTLLPMGMLASCVTSHHTYSELSPAFSWANITATDELQYHDCGGGFQCARLQFPLDWNATADSPIYNEKFKMAIVRAPAQVPVTDPRYGGPIILNFGGPGAPGTYFAAIYAQALQTSFDAAYSYGSETYVSDHPDARYFDLVFFDPRGVPNSTPWYTPFNNPVQAASLSSQILATQLEWPPQFNVRGRNQWLQYQQTNAVAELLYKSSSRASVEEE
jgi:hypothetical protein